VKKNSNSRDDTIEANALPQRHGDTEFHRDRKIIIF
jgi:hypothetical protein